MAKTEIRDIPSEEDKTLYLVMDGDGVLTGHPATIDRVLEKRETTEVRIIRVLASSADSDPNVVESDTRPRVNLTFEEIVSENCQDEYKMNNDVTVQPDLVDDPLSQLDTEAKQSLKKALASEQAKQILGENVTAMLDVLSVDDPTTFIQNSIRKDHCYTQLSPSADPRGPSFLQSAPFTPIKRSTVITKGDEAIASGSNTRDVKNELSPSASEEDSEEAEQSGDEEASKSDDTDRSSDSDYHDPNSGFRRDRRRRKKAAKAGASTSSRGRKRGRPRRETTRMDSDTSPVKSEGVHGSSKRGRPRKDSGRSVISASGEVTTLASSSTITPADHAAAKVMSLGAIKLGRPEQKSEFERKKEMARILEKLDAGRVKKQETNVANADLEGGLEEGEVVLNEAQGTSGHDVQVSSKEKKHSQSVVPVNVMGGKYPRRENRKLPSHLADTIIPELFSSPDQLRRKPTHGHQESFIKKPLGKVHTSNKDDESLPKSEDVRPVEEETPSDNTLLELENMLKEGLNDTQTNSVEKQIVGTPSETTNTVPDSNPVIENRIENHGILGVEEHTEVIAEIQNSNDVSTESDTSHKQRRIRSSTESKNSRDSSVDERKRDTEKRRRSDENTDVELEDSEEDDVLSEASWNSEDDPDKLWCICRKPHNNRFMICCDVCEEWFHGRCVGVTKSIGKQMEQDGLDWSCPSCTKKKRAEEREKEMKLNVKTMKPSDTKPTIQTKLSDFAVKKPVETRKCIVCHEAPVRENSIYCSDQCIRKHSQRALAELSASKTKVEQPVISEAKRQQREDRRVVVMDPNQKKVLTGLSAPTMSNLGAWLQQNPSYHVLFQKKTPVQGDKSRVSSNPVTVKKIVQIRQLPGGKVALSRPINVQSKIQVVKQSEGKASAQFVRSSGQRSLVVSPNSKRIKLIAQPDPLKVVQPQTQTFSVIRKLSVKDGESPQPAKVLKRELIVKKEPVVSKKPRKEKLQILQDFKTPLPTSKTEEKEKSNVTNANDTAVRESVRKSLGEALRARLQDAQENDFGDVDIEELAFKIEERLFKHFDHKVDMKYKSKFRSLVFNIKDPKNETLYRKILQKDINPKELVRLSAEELASQELAEWRAKENKHQLEIIKKTELELMTMGQSFIVKSHKGEEVIDTTTKPVEIDPNTSAKELVSALNSVSSTTPDNDEGNLKKGKSETSLMKMKKEEKERRREKERSRHKRDRSRSRSHSRHSKNRKRSRSRSRDRRRRSRSKDRKTHKRSKHSHEKEKEKDKERSRKDEKTKQKEEIKVDEFTTDVAKTSLETETLANEADYEPTSTVTIETPEGPSLEEVDEVPQEVDTSPPPAAVWSGEIYMDDVAKFRAEAVPASGDCTRLDGDVQANIGVVGRIAPAIVWDYLLKQKQLAKESASKDIRVLQIIAADPSQRAGFMSLCDYLTEKNRVGVIRIGISKSIKDFYIYPHNIENPFPEVLQPLALPVNTNGKNALLAIIVRKKFGKDITKTKQTSTTKTSLPIVSSSPSLPSATRPKLPLPEFPEVTKKSRTPPLPDAGLKLDSKKKKIRVHVAVSKKVLPEDDDSPYEPASSDEDLLPLPKLTKKSNVDEEYTPLPVAKPGNVATDADQIQKQIEEVNRAIEEQAQQIQSLASTVALPVIAPVLQQTGFIPPVFHPAIEPLENIQAQKNQEVRLPAQPPVTDSLLSSDAMVTMAESYTPDSFCIPSERQLNSGETTTAEPKLSLPDVSQVELPTNLENIKQILASIQQLTTPAEQTAPESSTIISTSPPPSSGVEKTTDPVDDDVGIEDFAPVKHKKKLDRSDIFETVEKLPVKTKPQKSIKIDLKLKNRDIIEKTNVIGSKDVDLRQQSGATVNLPAGGTSWASIGRKETSGWSDDENDILGPSSGDKDERILSMPSAYAGKDKHIQQASGSSSSNIDDRYRRDKRRSRDSSDYRRTRSSQDKIEQDWEDSIRTFEEEQRRRNDIIRDKEIERLRQRVNSE